MFFKNNKDKEQDVKQNKEENISEKWYEIDTENKCIKFKNGLVCGNSIKYSSIYFENIKEILDDKIIIVLEEFTYVNTDKTELDEEIINNAHQHLIDSGFITTFNDYILSDYNENIEDNKNKMKLNYLVEYTINQVKNELAVHKAICDSYNILFDSVSMELETPKDIFNQIKPYKLIETEEEFDDYMNRNCSVDDYCFIKVSKILRELGYGYAFHEFIPNIKSIDDLNKLKSLLDELKDPDVLYLALYKNFKQKG